MIVQRYYYYLDFVVLYKQIIFF